MAINKLKIMFNSNTRKYLRAATEDWKRNIIEQSGRTCWATGKKQKNNNGVRLTVHHVSQTYMSVVKQAHHNLNITYHELTTDYAADELTAVFNEVARLHKDVEGICLTKEFHDKLHRDHGPHATMEQLREMKRNYRKMNHNSRNKIYKSRRSA